MATVSSGLNSGSGFANSDVVTSTNLNNHVNSATVTNIANADVASNAAIEVTKLEELPAQSCIINPTSSAAVPDEHPIVIGGSGDAGILFDNDDMLDNSDTAGGSAARGATQQSIKAYVDASALTPSYVGISSNSSLTITQTDTSTTTHTYPIADFVGTGFNAAKVTGFYVEITALCRRLSTKTIADVKATFPDGTDHILLGHSCDTPEDQTSESRGTVFCPVTQGQTNLVIKPTLSGDTKSTTFTIVGCTQFV